LLEAPAAGDSAAHAPGIPPGDTAPDSTASSPGDAAAFAKADTGPAKESTLRPAIALDLCLKPSMLIDGEDRRHTAPVWLRCGPILLQELPKPGQALLSIHLILHDLRAEVGDLDLEGRHTLLDPGLHLLEGCDLLGGKAELFLMLQRQFDIPTQPRPESV